MDREETKKILMNVQAAYPNYEPQNKTVTINLWNKMLCNYSYEQVSSALEHYIATDMSGFAPSIGAIIQRIERRNKVKLPNEMEAWDMVIDTIVADWRLQRENYGKLPNIIKKCIGYNTLFDISNGYVDKKTVMPIFARCYRQELTNTMGDAKTAESAMQIEATKETEEEENTTLKSYGIQFDKNGEPIFPDGFWDKQINGE